jgi:myo-inositol 2-dehydrogenase/D-chiro-inositol 1-dehydrogenase
MDAAELTRMTDVAIFGAGRIGKIHAGNIANQAGVRLKYVVDPDVKAAEALAARHGASTGSIEGVFADPAIRAVAIASSTDTHADLIQRAAASGKAIFCEKPVSLDLAQVDRALAAVSDAGVPFQIGFNRRFDPAHAAVAQAVADGTVGEPQIARISSRDPAPPPLEYVRSSGGIFLDMTIHDFDMARFVTGSEVVEVFARGAVRVDPAIESLGDVDTAVVTLVHANGCLTIIDNSRQAVYGFDQRVEVFGSTGMAVSENPLAHSAIVRTETGMRAATLPYFFLERYIPSYLRQWQAFVTAVATGGTPPVSSLDARAPLVIGLAAWRSRREGGPVRLEGT